jgi:hypothetical protein
MKKTKNLILGAIFIAAISSCKDEPEWILGNGEENSPSDTVSNGQSYRHYNGGWYPVYNNMICPMAYSRAYYGSEIASPGFAPKSISTSGSASGVSTGGFGGSAGEAGGGGE